MIKKGDFSYCFELISCMRNDVFPMLRPPRQVSKEKLKHILHLIWHSLHISFGCRFSVQFVLARVMQVIFCTNHVLWLHKWYVVGYPLLQPINLFLHSTVRQVV